MPQEPLEYVATRVGLRAPRVAIVFDTGGDRRHDRQGDGWIPVAREALARANEFWGGSGFVLVPHIDGKISGEVLRVLRAYDPDYVVPFERPADPTTAKDGHRPCEMDAEPTPGRAS